MQTYLCRNLPFALGVILLINLNKSSFAFLSSENAFIPRRTSTTRHATLRIAATKVWIEIAEDGFVDEDENLMTGEICLRSIKAFANDPDHEGKNRFLGAAALVKRSASSDICDCWMADSLLEETNIQLQGAVALLDDLFCYHLQQRSNANNTLEEMISSFIVQCGSAESEYHCASYMAASNRGFKPLHELTYFKDGSHRTCTAYSHLEHLDLENEDLGAMVFDISSGIERYSINPSSDVAMSISNIIQKVKPKPLLERHFE